MPNTPGISIGTQSSTQQTSIPKAGATEDELVKFILASIKNNYGGVEEFFRKSGEDVRSNALSAAGAYNQDFIRSAIAIGGKSGFNANSIVSTNLAGTAMSNSAMVGNLMGNYYSQMPGQVTAARSDFTQQLMGMANRFLQERSMNTTTNSTSKSIGMNLSFGR